MTWLNNRAGLYNLPKTTKYIDDDKAISNNEIWFAFTDQVTVSYTGKG